MCTTTVKCMVYRYGRRIWGTAISKNTDTVREQRTQAQADSVTGVPQKEKESENNNLLALCVVPAWLHAAVKTKLSTITGLDWTGLKIIFMLANENSPVGLHLETQPLSFTESSENT